MRLGEAAVLVDRRRASDSGEHRDHTPHATSWTRSGCSRAGSPFSDEMLGARVEFARTGDPGWAPADEAGAPRRFG